MQTAVLANGVWTTQVMDIQHILTQNQEPIEQERLAPPLKPPQRPPLLGILSQTLIRSPVAKWIIPARIRHVNKNDVLFIYENYVEIQEVEKDQTSYWMKRVAVKADLDSSIRSARVFGLPRMYTAPLPEGDDAVVKKEDKEGDSWSSLRPELPPHILVLALDCNMLAFIFAVHDGAETVRFLQCRRPLPVARPSLEPLGELLAVDPKSRAMAVASRGGSFILYALRSMAEIRGAVQGDGSIDESRFQPVKEERHIHTEGQILEMEFLHPPEGQGIKDRVILLLVISKNRRSRLVCYEWDCATTLATASPIGDGQRLRADEQLPLLLVPLTRSTAFMLVFEKRITVYRDILGGNAIAYTMSMRIHEPREEPGIFQRPIWTQWARPSRHDLHFQNQDNIYLCREDGVVLFLEIKEGGQMVNSTHQVGNLGVNVNTSFASIDLGSRDSDLLVVSGDESDGGGWLFEARQDARKEFVIPNWTSMVDFVSTDDVDVLEAYPRHGAIRPDKNKLPKRLFASTGRGREHGGVTEIRYGIEGRKRTEPGSCREILQIGVTRIWVLDGFEKDSALVLLSYPMHTQLFQWSMSKGFEEFENDYKYINFDDGTIAAGATTTGLIIQVTKTSLRAAFYESDVEPLYEQVNVVAAHVQVSKDESKVCKVERAVWKHEFGKALLLQAFLSGTVHYLHLSTFELDGGLITHHSIGASIQLPTQPTFVSIEQVGGEYFAFVGTVAAALQVFRIEPRLGLSLATEYQFEGSVAVCDTVAVLDSQSARDRRHFILCGLRNGFLEVLKWDQKSSSNVSLVSYEGLKIGNTSITVLRDCVKPTRAIILCDQKLHTLEQPSKQSLKVQAPWRVNDVYLTESEHISFQHGKIDALMQGVSQSSPCLVVYVEGNQIYLASLSLEAEPSMISRRIPIGGTPKRVKYSPKLDKLIVLYHSTPITGLVAAPARHNRTDQRNLQYSIALVDPDAQTLLSNVGEKPLENSGISNHFKPDEIPLGVTEWFPQGNNGDHHVLVVNTLVQDLPPRQPSGRICLFSVSATGALALKKAVEKESPVHALASYGSNSLLYSCGTDLCLQSLSTSSNSSGWKFQDCVKFPLFSQVRHISVREPFIYVSTSGKSLLIFKVEGNKLLLQSNDEIARDNLFHLTIPQRSLVLTSQTDRIITGLWQHSEEDGTTKLWTVFEALLPGSITRFRHVNPSPWKQYPSSENLGIAFGNTTDGSFFQFNVLDEKAWRLLAFIQTLALRSPDICPFVNTFEVYRRPLEPSSTDPLDMHINGDILRRILERGGECFLIEMMSSEHLLKTLLSYDHILRSLLTQYPRHDVTSIDNNLDPHLRMVNEITKRETQVRQTMMREFAQGVGLKATNEADLVAKVVRWMIHLMQTVI